MVTRNVRDARARRAAAGTGALLVLSGLPCVFAGMGGSDKSDTWADFDPDNATMTCSADTHAHPFNIQLRGTNIGSWMVLEPWITPSLFYQFLGKTETTTAMDMYSFCEVLGPEEGNKQLRRHWDTWVTEDDVIELTSHNINSLRLPVGDWMYDPYGPYVGCTDGSLEYVDWFLDLCDKYNVSVLIDIHGVIDSQNGFDNSGQSQGLVWTSVESTEPVGVVTFEHWPIRSAGWMGEFDSHGFYKSINHGNIKRVLGTIAKITEMYKDKPAVLGLEPVNEPWQYTPIDELKRFYWEGYLIVKAIAPDWKFIMHDAFRFNTETWGGFMNGCPDIAIDTHIYQAWMNPGDITSFYSDACGKKDIILEMERAFAPVLVGEWSLATDNCAMWLNGFNDNLPGFPKLTCKFVQCPEPYMGSEQPGAPPDPTKPIQQPYGTGISSPSFGLCPVDIDWFELQSGKTVQSGIVARQFGEDEIVTDENSQLATDHVMKNLAHKKLQAFDVGHGWYFWNFKTELEAQWSYLEATNRGWFPDDLTFLSVETESACYKEDNGMFLCVAKRGIFESTIKAGMRYAAGSDTAWIEPLHGKELLKRADELFTGYWQEHRIEGATCDFGGAAELKEIHTNSTSSELQEEDDWDHYGDAEGAVDDTGASAIIVLAAVALVLGLIGLGVRSKHWGAGPLADGGAGANAESGTRRADSDPPRTDVYALRAPTRGGYERVADVASYHGEVELRGV